MCTMSLVTASDRLRVMFNRDEQHTRPEAWLPRAERRNGVTTLMPIDPAGGGTWIAATGAGLVFGLLNADGPTPAGGGSRGGIIPALVHCATVDAVIAEARGLCCRAWAPHRLVVANRRRAVELRLLGRGLSVAPIDLGAPVMVTSSSVDPDAVVPARRALFDALMHRAADPLVAQDMFHQHRWADRADVSVYMRRHDAATHSITTVDVRADGLAMRYDPLRTPAGRPGWMSVPRSQQAAVPADRGARLALVS